MACDYVLLPRAQADLDDIVRYLSVDLASPGAAARFLGEFEQGMASVCAFPELCPISRLPEVAARGYRSLPVTRYVVLYAHRDNRIVVAHIFHATQDYARYV